MHDVKHEDGLKYNILSVFRPCFLKKQISILSRTILWPLFMKKKDLVPAVLIPSGICQKIRLSFIVPRMAFVN